MRWCGLESLWNWEVRRLLSPAVPYRRQTNRAPPYGVRPGGRQLCLRVVRGRTPPPGVGLFPASLPRCPHGCSGTRLRQHRRHGLRRAGMGLRVPAVASCAPLAPDDRRLLVVRRGHSVHGLCGLRNRDPETGPFWPEPLLALARGTVALRLVFVRRASSRWGPPLRLDLMDSTLRRSRFHMPRESIVRGRRSTPWRLARWIARISGGRCCGARCSRGTADSGRDG
ncbi:hypothetical protein B0H15DRAFT_869284 [Mycena belliarum]|uniref:Uncharacterized protein n=1 Tax=Mycena belliarum TaxID=1033014 RepID=A0AAD6XIL1_9AGAR|nr:hypothetical protein B0H15DRAFT_869284 [Mycena belliae]